MDFSYESFKLVLNLRIFHASLRFRHFNDRSKTLRRVIMSYLRFITDDSEFNSTMYYGKIPRCVTSCHG